MKYNWTVYRQEFLITDWLVRVRQDRASSSWLFPEQPRNLPRASSGIFYIREKSTPALNIKGRISSFVKNINDSSTKLSQLLGNTERVIKNTSRKLHKTCMQQIKHKENDRFILLRHRYLCFAFGLLMKLVQGPKGSFISVPTQYFTMLYSQCVLLLFREKSVFM